SWERRERAHVEILHRGGSLLTEAAKRLAAARPGEPATEHLIWLAAAGRTPEAVDQLRKLAGQTDADLRFQAVRALAEFVPEQAGPVLARALRDADPRVRLAAVTAYFDRDEAPPEAVVTGPARDTDTYLRQAATLLLAEKAPLDQLDGLCRSKDEATRLAGVLAAGFRLTIPPANRPIPPELPLAKLRTPDAYVIRFADGTVDLRQLGRIGNFTVAEHWHAGKHTAEQERLFALLHGMLADAAEPVRLQAAHFLFLLDDPRSEPAVARVRKQSEERRLAVAPLKGVPKVWLAGPFADGSAGLGTGHEPERGPIDLAARYAAGREARTWKEMDGGSYFDLTPRMGPDGRASFYAYFRLESLTRQRALLLLGSDGGLRVWHNGKEVWNNPAARAALPCQDLVLLDLQPGGNDLLVRAAHTAGPCRLYLHYRALAPVVPQLPEKLAGASLAERLKGAAAGPAKIDPAFLQIDWEKAVGQGDAKHGRQLFGALGCVKCHAITADAGVTGGPSLAEARKRFTVPYVVESVLLPSKQVSPLFRATFIATERGQTYTGLVTAETGDKLELLLSDTTRKTIARSDIAERRPLDTSPMPQGLVKTPAELRDLLAYLFSDNPQPP
ncbi:MAG TPA: HEAT repeat domain-containing protein, partial [Gemmataceae bacterium]|nr:HEAT repeat domain-containing protein [Gemmataceae bacterium]